MYNMLNLLTYLYRQSPHLSGCILQDTANVKKIYLVYVALQLHYTWFCSLISIRSEMVQGEIIYLD